MSESVKRLAARRLSLDLANAELRQVIFKLGEHGHKPVPINANILSGELATNKRRNSCCVVDSAFSDGHTDSVNGSSPAHGPEMPLSDPDCASVNGYASKQKHDPITGSLSARETQTISRRDGTPAASNGSNPKQGRRHSVCLKPAYGDHSCHESIWHENRKKYATEGEEFINTQNRQRRKSISNVQMIKQNENKISNSVAIARKILKEIDKENDLASPKLVALISVQNRRESLDVLSESNRSTHSDFANKPPMKTQNETTKIRKTDGKEMESVKSVALYDEKQFVLDRDGSKTRCSSDQVPEKGDSSHSKSSLCSRKCENNNEAAKMLNDNRSRHDSGQSDRRTTSNDPIEKLDSLIEEWKTNILRDVTDKGEIYKMKVNKQHMSQRKTSLHDDILDTNRLASGAAFTSFMPQKRASLHCNNLPDASFRRQSTDIGFFGPNQSTTSSQLRSDITDIIGRGNIVRRTSFASKPLKALDVSPIMSDQAFVSKISGSNGTYSDMTTGVRRSSLDLSCPVKTGGRHSEERLVLRHSTPFRMQMYLQGLEKNYPTKTLLEIKRLKEKRERDESSDSD